MSRWTTKSYHVEDAREKECLRALPYAPEAAQLAVDEEASALVPFARTDALHLLDVVASRAPVRDVCLSHRHMHEWLVLSLVRGYLHAGAAEALLSDLHACEALEPPLRQTSTAFQFGYAHLALHGFGDPSREALIQAFVDSILPHVERTLPTDFADRLAERLLARKLPGVRGVSVGTRRRRGDPWTPEYHYKHTSRPRDMDAAGKRIATPLSQDSFVVSVRESESALLRVECETLGSADGELVVDVSLPVVLHVSLSNGRTFGHTAWVLPLRLFVKTPLSKVYDTRSALVPRTLSPPLAKTTKSSFALRRVQTHSLVNMARMVGRPTHSIGVYLVFSYVEARGSWLAAREVLDMLDGRVRVDETIARVLGERLAALTSRSSHAMRAGKELVVRAEALARVHCPETHGRRNPVASSSSSSSFLTPVSAAYDPDRRVYPLSSSSSSSIGEHTLFAFSNGVFADPRTALLLNVFAVMRHTARACLETEALRRTGVTTVDFIGANALEDRQF